MRSNAGEGLLSSAAMTTVGLHNSPEVLLSTRFVLDQIGQVLAAAIRPGERISLFVPGHVGRREHWLPGAMVLAGSRLLLGWSSGRYRRRRRVVSVQRADVGPVTSTRRRIGDLGSTAVCLTIATVQGPHEFALPVYGADDLLARYVGQAVDWFRLGST